MITPRFLLVDGYEELTRSECLSTSHEMAFRIIEVAVRVALILA